MKKNTLMKILICILGISIICMSTYGQQKNSNTTSSSNHPPSVKQNVTIPDFYKKFIGTWKGYDVGYNGNEKVIGKESSSEFKISYENNGLKIFREAKYDKDNNTKNYHIAYGTYRNNMIIIEKDKFYQNGKLNIIMGNGESENQIGFYKKTVPTIEYLSDGTLQYSDGVGDVILIAKEGQIKSTTPSFIGKWFYKNTMPNVTGADFFLTISTTNNGYQIKQHNEEVPETDWECQVKEINGALIGKTTWGIDEMVTENIKCTLLSITKLKLIEGSHEYILTKVN